MAEKGLRIRVRFFGYTAERAGCAERELTVETATVAGVADAIRAELPEVLDPNVKFAVGTDYADESTAVSDGDVVSLIPPVGGG